MAVGWGIVDVAGDQMMMRMGRKKFMRSDVATGLIDCGENGFKVFDDDAH